MRGCFGLVFFGSNFRIPGEGIILAPDGEEPRRMGEPILLAFSDENIYHKPIEILREPVWNIESPAERLSFFSPSPYSRFFLTFKHSGRNPTSSGRPRLVTNFMASAWFPRRNQGDQRWDWS